MKFQTSCLFRLKIECKFFRRALEKEDAQPTRPLLRIQVQLAAPEASYAAMTAHHTAIATRHLLNGLLILANKSKITTRPKNVQCPADIGLCISCPHPHNIMGGIMMQGLINLSLLPSTGQEFDNDESNPRIRQKYLFCK